MMGDGQPDDELREGRDFYVDASGLYVFTSDYLRRRGTCCGNKCRHCPYAWANVDPARVATGERPDTLSARPASSARA